MSSVCSSGLRVDVCLDDDRVLVAVHGELDTESSPLMRTVVRGLIVGGHGSLALDLQDVSFMGAAGLGVIAEAAGLLRSAGGALTVLDASPMTMRILQMTGIGLLVDLEHAPASVGTFDRPSVDVHLSDHIGGEPVEVVSDLVKVGSMITATALVDRALQLVTVLARAAIVGADGVSVSLERHDSISTVAWSNATVLEMDRHQYETREGPCLDAATSGDRLYSESLAAEDRWPEFVPLALEEGIASILSSPLTTPDRSIGALNIYSNSERAFGPAQVELAGLFAEQASVIVGASMTDHEVGSRLGQALLDREVIAQAQGVFMGGRRMSAEQAAAELFRAARDAELNVSQHAANVIAATAPGIAAPRE